MRDGKEFTYFDKKENMRWIKILFFAVLIVLVLLDFVVKKHPHYSWEALPGAYAVYGFLSCVVIVAVSKVIGKLFLQRKEDYYD